MDGKGFKIPGWVAGLTGLLVINSAVVSWAYGTFVTIRERDMMKPFYDSKLESMDRKLDYLIQNAKMRDEKDRK